MKKSGFVVCVIALLAVGLVIFALPARALDDEARISQLQKEQRQVNKQFQQLEQRKDLLTKRFSWLQGGIDELRNQAVILAAEEEARLAEEAKIAEAARLAEENIEAADITEPEELGQTPVTD